MSLEEFAGISR